jgi:hypothetical protein
MASHDQRTIQAKLHFGQDRQFASFPLTFLDLPMMTIIYWYRLAGPANFAQIVAKPQGAASWPPTRFCVVSPYVPRRKLTAKLPATWPPTFRPADGGQLAANSIFRCKSIRS